ncbi:MAG: glutathione S-transferase family protein [Proteobacteria bacterium]|nr:glutathione S-transferase family protein [Pseudomonadota bacterium]
MKLHDCKMAPNPRRARIFLAEKGINVEKVEHSILAGETCGAAYLKINSWGTVPALELDDGTVIREAPAIFRYIEAEHPSPNLLGTNPKEAAEIESWERFAELQGMGAIGEFFRNQTEALAGRGLPGPSKLDLIPALVERGKTRAAWFYSQLDDQLGKTEYLGSKQYSVADITAQCAVDFGNAVSLGIPDNCKNVKRWHKAVSARASASA